MTWHEPGTRQPELRLAWAIMYSPDSHTANARERAKHDSWAVLVPASDTVTDRYSVGSSYESIMYSMMHGAMQERNHDTVMCGVTSIGLLHTRRGVLVTVKS